MIVDRYYYHQLNKQEQEVYKAFYDGVMAHEEIIPIPVRCKFSQESFEPVSYTHLDARYEFHNLNGTIDPQHQFPVNIDSFGVYMKQQDVKWRRSLNYENGKTTIKDAEGLTYIAKKVQHQIMTGDKSLVLPLISYYGTGRLLSLIHI